MGTPSASPAADRRISAALSVSAALHVVVLIALTLVAFAPQEMTTLSHQVVRLVYVPTAGPNGGGGGAPEPATPKPLEVPQHRIPAPPVGSAPLPTADPPPELNAPILTPNAEFLRASGATAVSLRPYGGLGSGRGVGGGHGNGLGTGDAGGTGGSLYGPGAGVVGPTLLKAIKPAYTADAMRARIEGRVVLEAVVLRNGTVSNIKVVHSLDAMYGLDDQAIRAAGRWLFQPAMKDGQPVDFGPVSLVLDFTIY